MSSSDHPAGAGDAPSHRYICSHRSTTVSMDPSTGSLLVCPICQVRVIDQSSLPSSSSSPPPPPPPPPPTSRPLNPDAAPFFPFPPTRIAFSCTASFEHRHPGDDFVHVVSDSCFFSSPYADAEAVITPLPAVGSVLPFRFLRRYIDHCLNEGAIINTSLLQRQIMQLLENYSNFCFPQSAPQSAIAALPDVKMTADLLCPVCREAFEIGEEAKQMPCKHVYHKDCIVPWLELRNSCPVCRFKLKADDGENVSGVAGDEMEGSREESAVEEGLDSYVTRFEIEMIWPFQARYSRLEIRGSEDGHRSGGGGEGDGGDSGGNEDSGAEGQEEDLD